MNEKNCTIVLEWFDDHLRLRGHLCESLKNHLSYWHREFIYHKGEYDPETGKYIPAHTETKNKKVLLYDVTTDEEGDTLITYPGFENKIKEFARKSGKTIIQKDYRLKFPDPELSKGVSLLKNYQKLVFVEGVSKNKNGCFSLPTRYGKTYIMAAICNAFPGLKTVIAAPGVDLLNQLVDKIQSLCPDRTVKGIFTGSKTKKLKEDIVVCSFDSLDEADKTGTKLLLVDEPHAAVTENRTKSFNEFANARRYGFGATLSGRFDNADILIEGLFGPVVAKRTFRKAVEEKAICDLKVYMVKIEFKHFDCANRNSAYKQMVFQNKNLINIVDQISCDVIPYDWQTLIFINNEKQALSYQKVIKNSVIGMDKYFKKNKINRQEFIQNMVNNKTKRCICSSIYNQGTTFPDVRALINCSGGGKSTSTIQKPGRLAEIRPNKTQGYVIDFLFECSTDKTQLEKINKNKKAWNYVCRDSQNRLKTYEDIGYNVEVINDLSEMELT